MDIPVRNRDGDTVDTIQLNDAVFNVPMNPSLVHQALVIYQMNKRQGTHSTKTRAEVSGGGRKPWIQKHTGRARQGSIRSPQWRHGGVVFGPKPRDYRKALPRRMRRQALKCVLSDKARQDRLICLESWDGADGKDQVDGRTAAEIGSVRVGVDGDLGPGRERGPGGAQPGEGVDAAGEPAERPRVAAQGDRDYDGGRGAVG